MIDSDDEAAIDMIVSRYQLDGVTNVRAALREALLAAQFASRVGTREVAAVSRGYIILHTALLRALADIIEATGEPLMGGDINGPEYGVQVRRVTYWHLEGELQRRVGGRS